MASMRIVAFLLFCVCLVAAQEDPKQLKQKHKQDADDVLSTPVKTRGRLRALLLQCGSDRFKQNLSEDERLQWFQKRVKKISDDNASNAPFVSIINCMSLLTDNEFAAMNGAKRDDGDFANQLNVNADGDALDESCSEGTARRLNEENAEDFDTEGNPIQGRMLQGRKRNPPPSPIRVSPRLPVSPSPTPPHPSPVPAITCTLPDCDWRNLNGFNYVAPTRNQGGCGSCWAFAARAAWEAAMMVNRQVAPVPAGQSYASIAASSQYLLDCSPSTANNTVNPTNKCNGGWPDEAWVPLRTYGAVDEAVDPYVGSMNACVYPSNMTYPKSVTLGNTVVIDQWMGLNSNNVAALKQALTRGPLSIVVQAAFGGYGGGVYFCASTSETSYNHAMLLVGVKNVVDANGVSREAWIVQNSWGSGWGVEGGYIYITTNTANDCGVSQWYAARPAIAQGRVGL